MDSQTGIRLYREIISAAPHVYGICALHKLQNLWTAQFAVNHVAECIKSMYEAVALGRWLLSQTTTPRGHLFTTLAQCLSLQAEYPTKMGTQASLNKSVTALLEAE